MRRHTRPNRCFSGRHLWTCVPVALALVLDTRAAAAKECHGETPHEMTDSMRWEATP